MRNWWEIENREKIGVSGKAGIAIFEESILAGRLVFGDLNLHYLHFRSSDIIMMAMMS